MLVTRPAGQAAELSRRLEERGVAVTCVPTVATDAASCADELRAALRGLDGAAWLVITSVNGAGAVTRSIAGGAQLPRGIRIAAVGPATADALRAAGLEVDHMPAVYRTAAIADGLGDVAGRRVVLARADAATDELPEALRARHADVEEVVAYRTIEGPAASRDALHAALQLDLHAIAFTSSSTVDGLMSLATSTDRARARALPSMCIGPVTAATARFRGFHVVGVAAQHTAAGLADAIAHHFGSAGS